jgi:hypothetical protein
MTDGRALEAIKEIISQCHNLPHTATAARIEELARALLALSGGERSDERSDIIDQIRAWYGYDAAFRPIGEAAIAEITRLRAERPGAGWHEAIEAAANVVQSARMGKMDSGLRSIIYCITR